MNGILEYCVKKREKINTSIYCCSTTEGIECEEILLQPIAGEHGAKKYEYYNSPLPKKKRFVHPPFFVCLISFFVLF